MTPAVSGDCLLETATQLRQDALKKNLGKFPAYLSVIEGVVTAWIPGFLMLVGLWK